MARIALFLFILAGITACERNHLGDYMAHGTLMRIDSQGCTCCGGIVLQIDRDPRKYRIDSIRSFSLDILTDLSLPRRIHFDYADKRTCDSTFFLTLSSFETEGRP